MKVLFTDDMRRIEQNTIDMGVSGLALMENAAHALKLLIESKFTNEIIGIICGPGNNGGDGFALSRQLMESGKKVSVFCVVIKENLLGDAKKQVELFENSGGTIRFCSDASTFDEEILKVGHCDVWVDALFGIGLSRVLDEVAVKAVTFLNETQGYILSVDIPSGIHADTGEVLGCAVKADVTVTFANPKPGHFLFPGRAHTGELIVSDIGTKEFFLNNAQMEVLQDTDAQALLPARKMDTHKGTYGHAVIFAGSKGMAGAGELSAKAALRSGVGLVTLCTPACLWEVYQKKLTEAMVLPLPEKDGMLCENSLNEKAKSLILKAKSIAFGPGVGISDETTMLLRNILTNFSIPIVVDADGLSIIASHLSWLRETKASVILTPHVGEMARLLDVAVDEIVKRPMLFTKKLACETNAVVLLKSATSVIASPNEDLTFNVVGNPGMATGGSGDVLTGIVASLLAQGLSAYDSARLGAYLHGCAGDLAAAQMGYSALIASDEVDNLPKVLKRLNR